MLLDYVCRELAIKVDNLNATYQENLLQQSSQRLIEPWAIDENESLAMEHAAVLFPRAVHWLHLGVSLPGIDRVRATYPCPQEITRSTPCSALATSSIGRSLTTFATGGAAGVEVFARSLAWAEQRLDD